MNIACDFKNLLDWQEMTLYDRNDNIYAAIRDFEKEHKVEVTLRYFVSPLSRNKDSMVLDFECLCADKIHEQKLSQLLAGRYLIPVVLRSDLQEEDRIKSHIWKNGK